LSVGLNPFWARGLIFLGVLVLVPMVSTYDNGGRWRELRAREVPELGAARRNVAERALPSERHLEPVGEGTSAANPLGLVWVVTSYPLVAAGLEKALEGKADVRIGGDSVAGSPSCVVLYADGMEEGLVDGMGRVRGLYPGVPLLVFGPRLDLALAWAALKRGADGFVHAAMDREQVAKAVEVAEKGELVAPRELLRHLVTHQEKGPDVGALSPRQREVLALVAEDLSNAEIAGRLYLSESTVKQHLRTAYKLLGARNRTEAARMVKDHARDR
jgi:DNA-binding NarL/FixJ family response regulator